MDRAEELAASRASAAVADRRAPPARSFGARAPVFGVFIELYQAALEAMPPDRRRRRA